MKVKKIVKKNSWILIYEVLGSESFVVYFGSAEDCPKDVLDLKVIEKKVLHDDLCAYVVDTN